MCGSDSEKTFHYRVLAGSESAADELDRRFRQRLCALVEREMDERFRRREDPEDIVQSVFRTFFRRARGGEFAIDQSVAVWHLLVKITINKVRRKAKFHNAATRHDDKTSPVDSRHTATKDHFARARQGHLMEATQP